MHTSSSFVRIFFAIIVLAVGGLMSGCPGNPTAAPDTKLSDAEAASLFAAALGSQSGGFMMYLGDAEAVAHGGSFPARAEKNGGAQILRDTLLRRNRTSTVDGKTYSFDYSGKYSLGYTDLIFTLVSSYYYKGNVALKLADTMSPGTMTTPLITSADSVLALLLLYHTDSSVYSLQGRFGRYGRFTMTASGKVFTGKVETSALIPGVPIDSATGLIINHGSGANGSTGDIDMALKGTMADGTPMEASCSFISRPGQPPMLVTNNNKYYRLDIKAGTATFDH